MTDRRPSARQEKRRYSAPEDQSEDPGVVDVPDEHRVESRSYSKDISRVKKLKHLFLIGTVIFSGLLICLFLFYKPSRRPNIVLVLVDALRADHLGAYGYERNTTPVLDRFARENVLFTRAVSASNWTPVSIASTFTGLYAASHGMVPPTHNAAAAHTVRLSENFDTLAEILKRGGYQTAAVITNAWLKKEFGYAQGFDTYESMRRGTANAVTESAAKILAKLQKKKAPFFLYLHYLDPHEPYEPPPPYNSLFQGPLRNGRHSAKIEEKSGLYDGEIRFADMEIGKFFEELRRRNLYKDAFIIVSADHGEQFGERGYQGHHDRLYAEETHVPLIMKSGESPHEVRETVSNIDIYPTIIGAAHVAIPADTLAVSLREEDRLRKRSGVISESFQKYHHKAFVTGEGKKIIMDFGSPYKPENQDFERTMAAARVEGLFDLDRDPLEQAPLKNERLENDLRKELETILRLALRQRKDLQKGKTSGKTLEELKSLGYLK
jgi:arylsulfatase